MEQMLQDKAERYMLAQKEWLDNIEQLKSKYEAEKEQLNNEMYNCITI